MAMTILTPSEVQSDIEGHVIVRYHDQNNDFLGDLLVNAKDYTLTVLSDTKGLFKNETDIFMVYTEALAQDVLDAKKIGDNKWVPVRPNAQDD